MRTAFTSQDHGTALGRNGWMSVAGIEVADIEEPIYGNDVVGKIATRIGTKRLVLIEPITSRGIVGRCSISFDRRILPALIDALIDMEKLSAHDKAKYEARRQA